MSATNEFDALIIGAGFAGMYQLHKLRDEQGLRVRVFERGDGVGGTWYWNRYPGARCDIDSIFYSFSFDKDLEQEWDWSERFATQPELLKYANHIADRFDLRRDISFETSVVSAEFDDASNRWTVLTDDGERYQAQYLITAVGCLSSSQVPAFEGVDSFEGPTYHTGRWPHEGVDFTGLRVAVIGTGSSGIQSIPLIAQEAEHVTVFQRTPHFSVPARNAPLSEERLVEVKADYPSLREQARYSTAGYLVPPPIGAAADFSEEEQRAELAKRWDNGGIEYSGTFTDVMADQAANDVVAGYVRERIRGIVDDPELAEKLSPHEYPIGSKRLCLDTNYYATYNRDNVTLVSVKQTPIERITPRGVQVDGVEYEADVIVFATGYDAMTGPLNAIDIRGLGGALLRDEWAEGPRTYLGIAAAKFPNLFMITAPGSPSVLSNMIVSIEQHVEWVSDYIAHARTHGIERIEADEQAQDEWVTHVNEVASMTLFPKAASWYMGANIPGKTRVFMPYLGGVGPYRTLCAEVAADGYRGFALTKTPALVG